MTAHTDVCIMERMQKHATRDDAEGLECGDPLCGGHVDESTSACIVCGETLGSVCWDCGAYGPCARNCPNRAPEAADGAGAWP